MSLPGGLSASPPGPTITSSLGSPSAPDGISFSLVSFWDCNILYRKGSPSLILPVIMYFPGEGATDQLTFCHPVKVDNPSKLKRSQTAIWHSKREDEKIKGKKAVKSHLINQKHNITIPVLIFEDGQSPLKRWVSPTFSFYDTTYPASHGPLFPLI